MKLDRITSGRMWTAFAVMIGIVLSAFAHTAPRAPESAGLIA
jgi:hypothetical protein